MYHYEEDTYIPVTKTEVLNRTTQEEIFSIVENGKYEPIVHNYIISPFREDDSPGCYFEWYANKLRFIDWADDEATHRDCFDFIQTYYNLSFKQALYYINEQLNLGLGHSVGINPVKAELKKKEGQTKKKKPKKEKHDIEFKARRFGDRDKKYWSQYYIRRGHLLEDNTFAIIWYKFWSNKREDWLIIRPTDICYAYTFPNGTVKIYRPQAKNKKAKWITSCTENDIGGLHLLPDFVDILIITKSYKDWRVLINLGYNAIWFQNEGAVPDTHRLADLCKRSNHIVILFDNDKAGIKAAYKVQEEINNISKDKSKIIYLPKKLLQYNIKDPSDLIVKHKKRLELFLRKNLKF